MCLGACTHTRDKEGEQEEVREQRLRSVQKVSTYEKNGSCQTASTAGSNRVLPSLRTSLTIGNNADDHGVHAAASQQDEEVQSTFHIDLHVGFV